jgi:monoamine oxidase
VAKRPSQKRLAILGGGFSGLFFAYLFEPLAPPGTEITVFEGSERLGGRIETSVFEEHGVRYESGAAELYDITGAGAVLELVRNLGLSVSPMRATPTFFFEGHELARDEDFERAFGAPAVEALDAFWELGLAQRPPQGFAFAGHPQDNEHPWAGRSFESVLDEMGSAVARRFTEIQCHSDLATEPELTTGTFGFDNLLIDHPGYNEMYTIDGGNEQLIERLAAAVAAPKLLRTRIERVEALDSDGFRVRIASDGDVTDEVFDGVVVTPPVPALRRVEFVGGGLDEVIEAHAQHHDHPATYLRVTLLFERRFWAARLPEDYFVSDAFGGVTIYEQSPDRSEPDGRGVLSWLLGGAPADEAAALADEEILRQLLDTLPAPLAEGRDLMLDYRVDRWQGERGVVGLPGGSPLLPLRERHQPSPAHPALIVIGDYMYDATINGALDAASEGVALMLEALGVEDPPTPAAILQGAGLAEAPVAPRKEDGGHLPFLRR